MVGGIRQTNHAALCRDEGSPDLSDKNDALGLRGGWQPRLESYFQDGALKRFPDELMIGYGCMIL